VLQRLRPSGRAAVALTIAVVATATLPLLGPQFTRAFVDGAIAGQEISALMLIAVGYLLVAIFGQGAKLLTAWLASRLAWDGTNRLREDLAEHALDLDMDYHGQHTPGEMIERVDGDVVALSNFLVALLLDVIVSLLLLAGVVIVVFSVDWRIGAVLSVYCGLVGFGMVRMQRMVVPAAMRMREMHARMFGVIEERLAGAEDIRANGAGRHSVNRLHRASAEVYRADLKENKLGAAVYGGTTIAFAAGTAIVLALAAWAQRNGTLTLGTAVLLFQYTQMVRTPFERLIDQLEQYRKAVAGVARIGQLLGTRRILDEPEQPIALPDTGPLSLELDNVDFAYPDDGEPVLSDVDIKLAPGETLGVVGRTGSGKTTIARLALRLYDPTAGSVRIGGVDAREAGTASVRKRVSVVTQDVQLFAATVRDNVTLFGTLGNGDDTELITALRDVGLGSWLDQLPDGLDTELGPQGGGVSAGQGQLLAFARAFLTDPGIVVLDEASSRLDPATELVIEDAIGKLLAERTAVVIAHRLSSLRRVDQIAVVSDGRVVEYGRRTDLAADPTSHFAGLLAAAGVTAPSGAQS
jgi:ABC-type multidrug transport system fused ATPase/permease subunit